MYRIIREINSGVTPTAGEITGATIGNIHAISSGLSYFGIGGGATAGIAQCSGFAGLAYGTVEIWYMAYYVPLMRVVNSEPTTGNPEMDNENGKLFDLGVYHPDDVFRSDW